MTVTNLMTDSWKALYPCFLKVGHNHNSFTTNTTKYLRQLNSYTNIKIILRTKDNLFKKPLKILNFENEFNKNITWYIIELQIKLRHRQIFD